MTANLEQYGLEYVGTTIVYLTETSMRHYYTITDEDLFNAVKNEITFGGASVDFTEKNGQIYFEYKGIPAKELGTPITFKIGSDEYQYSVLDYVRACLKSTKVSENTKLLSRLPIVTLSRQTRISIDREVSVLKKESYERTELELIKFRTEDVITTSGSDPDEYEGEMP